MNIVTRFFLFVVALLAPVFAFAEVDPNITAAFTAANANVTAVVGGIITLAAIVTGLALIYRWLSK